jgi:hypothetical protein
MKTAKLTRFLRGSCRPCRGRPSGGRIFICYRRDDSKDWARFLQRRLAAAFGADNVFLDIVKLDPGVDFRVAIRRELASCNTLLAIVGPNWLTVTDDHGRCIDNEEDWVRAELEFALEAEGQIRIFPVLVNDADMPDAADVPSSLALFTYKQAFELHLADLDGQVERLVARLRTPKPPKFAKLSEIKARTAPLWAFVVNAMWRPLWPNALLPIGLLVGALLISGAWWLGLAAVLLWVALGVTTFFDGRQARCVDEWWRDMTHRSPEETSHLSSMPLARPRQPQ